VKSVFAGGSRNIKRLKDRALRQLDTIVEENLSVLVGDANGAGKAIQKHLADQKYRNVIVYCMDGGPEPAKCPVPFCRIVLYHQNIAEIPNREVGRGDRNEE
jgi:hypothetical protein